MASTALDDLVLEARRLNADQIKLLVQVARAMHGDQTKPPYDRSKDPAINLFDGDEDLSERVEGIIEEAARERGGWTRKDAP